MRGVKPEDPHNACLIKKMNQWDCLLLNGIKLLEGRKIEGQNKYRAKDLPVSRGDGSQGPT